MSIIEKAAIRLEELRCQEALALLAVAREERDFAQAAIGPVPSIAVPPPGIPDGAASRAAAARAWNTPARAAGGPPPGASSVAQLAAVAGPAVARDAVRAINAPKIRTAQYRRIDFDRPARASAALLLRGAARSRIAEQYRVIKRPLIDAATARETGTPGHQNVVMITSAEPGEGKTFSAINLAVSIAAEMNNTVMLVEADVARPDLLGTLGIAPGRGLLDLLVDPALDMADLLLSTNVKNLRILPAGTAQAHATELLASEAMRRLVDEMSRRYSNRIIIFDSPPLNATTEARALAAHMGQIVIVVRAEHTSEAQLQRALRTIETHPARMLLLNGARGDSAKDRRYAAELAALGVPAQA